MTKDNIVCTKYEWLSIKRYNRHLISKAACRKTLFDSNFTDFLFFLLRNEKRNNKNSAMYSLSENKWLCTVCMILTILTRNHGVAKNNSGEKKRNKNMTKNILILKQ